jgi:PTH2 family peptidyl-tRNA hydrolase
MKQIIVMRKDLGMRAGKMVSQGAHASVASVERFRDDPRVKAWLASSFTKITVRVESEAELTTLYDQAVEAGLLAVQIVDSGRTEFDGVPTLTCIAIGPDTDEKLEPITGELKLL